jgi:hypothetical protein
VTAVGEIDLSNPDSFRDALGPAAPEGGRFVVDLTAVQYLASPLPGLPDLLASLSGGFGPGGGSGGSECTGSTIEPGSSTITGAIFSAFRNGTDLPSPASR